MTETNAITAISTMRAEQREIPVYADPFYAGFEQLLFEQYEKSFAASVRVLSALDAMLETMIRSLGEELPRD